MVNTNNQRDIYSHSVIVNGVVFKGDKVLVSQRSFEEEHEPGKWTIPGGKVEREGDNEVLNILEKTLAKEVEEETGVKISLENVRIVTNNTFFRANGQHVIAIVFACNFEEGEAKPLEDTIACKWASEEEVRGMEFPPNVKEYILKAYEGK